MMTAVQPHRAEARPIPVKPLRIAYLATELGLGGAEVVTRTLFNEWRSRGHDPSLILTYTPGINAERIRQDGHPVQALDLPRGLKIIARVAEVREAIRKLAPDVVILNNQDALLPWAWTLGRGVAQGGGNAPVFAAIHSTEAGGMRVSDWIHRLFLPRYAKVITLGEPHAKYAQERFGLRQDQIAVIHNGIEPAAPKPLEAPLPTLPKNSVTGVIVARLHPEKNHKGLFDAMKLLAVKHPEFHLLVAGQGDAHNDLEAHAQHLGLADRIHFLGARGDVGAVLEQAQIGFISSVTTETLSIAVLEYMRAGLPVIATRVGSLSDQVLDGRTGFLVAPNDPNAMASAISTLLESPVLRSQFGRAGRELQAQKFTAANMAEGYLGLFERVLRHP